jgi:ectoine hydroxylase-related dioxygenase (phytanoyl-CoA dioxygenase family)
VKGVAPFDQEALDRATAAYAKDGYAVLSPAFDGRDVAAWRGECEWLAAAVDEVDARDPRVQTRARPEGGVVRDRYDPVSDFSTLFRALSGDPRLQAVAAAVLGEKPVRFKDRLILKSAGTGGYGLHRDWPYWEFLGVPPGEFVSVMLCVDACDESNGALEVFPGLHRAELVPAPQEPRDLDPKAVEGLSPAVARTAAGDVLLLHPMAPHRSGPNLSGRSRRIVTFVFTPERNATASGRYYAALQSPAGR